MPSYWEKNNIGVLVFSLVFCMFLIRCMCTTAISCHFLPRVNQSQQIWNKSCYSIIRQHQQVINYEQSDARMRANINTFMMMMLVTSWSRPVSTT